MKSGFGIVGLNNGNLRTNFNSAFAVFGVKFSDKISSTEFNKIVIKMLDNRG